ncbi:hypothetical protein PRECH8_14540 [Insulibacter thermoxylanivorax]|uniref:Uncharacterized protein n=1 Tax=Insulibacter thermoxylanivorax TaxID=2749268 RepID=A0A916QEW3_9BACL|nr:hypothetical protein PRECH8_14540 [Insulibacter thermoxylanivorax]
MEGYKFSDYEDAFEPARLRVWGGVIQSALIYFVIFKNFSSFLFHLKFANINPSISQYMNHIAHLA